MRLDRLRSLTTDPGPFATVLLDATSDDAAGAEQVRLRWRNVRDDLERQGAGEDTLRVLDDAVEAGRAPDGTAGRVLVAGSGGLLLDRFVEVPPSGVGTGTWSGLPDLLTIAAEVPDDVPAVAVFVEDAGGLVRAPGGTEPERVDGDPSGPVHKANVSGPGERGAQDRVEETWRRNAKAVADRVEKLASASGAQLVVVTGTGPARSRLRDELTPHTLGLVHEIDHSGGEFPDDLPATMLRAADDVRAGRRERTLERYAAAVGRSDGFAVTGLADVLSAARAQAVDVLVLDPDRVPEGEVWVAGRGDPSELAADREELAALGAEPDASVPVVPALIRAVAAAGGELVLTGSGSGPATGGGPDTGDGPDGGPDGGSGAPLTEGVGAVLRFPIGPAA